MKTFRDMIEELPSGTEVISPNLSDANTSNANVSDANMSNADAAVISPHKYEFKALANEGVGEYLAYIDIRTLLTLFVSENIIIKRWNVADKDGFQRLENKRHIQKIIKYIVKKEVKARFPLPLIMNVSQSVKFNSPKGSFRFANDMAFLTALIKLSLLDGQHRLLAFKDAVDAIDIILNAFDGIKSKKYKTAVKLLSEYMVYHKSSKTLNTAQTKIALTMLKKQLLSCKLSCCIFDGLTDIQEGNMFVDINTKGLKAKKGTVQNVEYLTKLATEDKDCNLVWEKELQFSIMEDETNVFYGKVKPENTVKSEDNATLNANLNGSLTEGGFINGFEDSGLINAYKKQFGGNYKKDFNNFKNVFFAFWSTLANREAMKVCFSNTKDHTFLKTTGFTTMNMFLAHLIENYPNKLNAQFFNKCFNHLEVEYLNSKKWELKPSTPDARSLAVDYQGAVGYRNLFKKMEETFNANVAKEALKAMK